MTESKIQIRVSGEEKAMWQERSAQMGLTLTEMIKEAVGEFVMTDKGGVMTEKGTIPSPKKVEIKTDIIEGPQVTTSRNNYTGPRTMGGNVKDLVKRGLVKKGVKELPSQDEGGFKTYFK